MSTPRCARCKQYYWRYNGSYRGYCSYTCWNARQRRKKRSNIAYEDWTRMQAMQAHRLAAHGSSDLVLWYDCEECERLEAEVAAALNG